MQITITDPVFKPKSKYNFAEAFFLKFIRDERDLPFIWLMLRITFIIIPIAIFLFFYFTWWLAVPFLIVNTAIGLGPYILMLHNTSHRKLFKQEYNWMNNIIPWALGPFYGETPETYFAHHVMMHHAENNLIDDLSCTMHYRRDSFLDFMKYFVLFLFLGMVDLGYYFKRKQRRKFLIKILVGEVGFLIMCAVLWQFNSQATLMVFLLPFVLARFLMMAGNWAQHAFIDGKNPSNSYGNSITCINCGYNKQCFNDGYHIGHHLRPTMHWTDMPNEFYNNIQKYKDNNAIVFQGTDFFMIWFLLMTKNYRTLAGHYIDIRRQFKSTDETIAFLKSRVAVLPVQRISLNANVIFNGIR